jgi:dipeptidyl aminopeptidase/acylaminoacyl peptidase
MPTPKVSPFGSWKSSISAEAVAAGDIRLGQIHVSQGHVYWAETRPQQGGRVTILRKSPDAPPQEALPPTFNCRTRVHEYGGGAFLAQGLTLFCSSFSDQRLYRLDPGRAPTPITPEPEVKAGLRFADSRLTPDGSLLICVREDHTHGGEAVNELVALPPDGSREVKVLASGRDFYASPRISPDGRRLAWMCWDHPRMPWDGCELWVADLGPSGRLDGARQVAGGEAVSIFQPEWSPEGVLYFVSDVSGWWNLYRLQDAKARPLAPAEAEFGAPQWGFGLSYYDFLPDGRLASIVSRGARDQLLLIDPHGGEPQPLPIDYSSLHPYLRFDPASGRLLLIASSHRQEPELIAVDPQQGNVEILHSPGDRSWPPDLLSEPTEIEFPTAGGVTAHALFYAPRNADFRGPDGELPPCLVISHGGPTSRTTTQFDLEIQYWTSRGLAVVDVNYGGSTGYGRRYRERLNGQWGIVDVQDCIQAVRYLTSQGRVDARRLIIRGGSAGGYTTLCALIFHSEFTAGASYYGVADVEMLAQDTHKFESRYADGLIGPYPETAALYRERSPLHAVDRISCPIILFQGLEDPVVPPSQAEALVAALRAKGIPHAYLAFEGEAHGFRQAVNIRRSLEAELFFYSRVFGFELAEPIEPVEIYAL